MLKKLETILISVCIIGLILFVFRLPGANVLLILSLGSLSVVYMALGAVLFRNQ